MPRVCDLTQGRSWPLSAEREPSTHLLKFSARTFHYFGSLLPYVIFQSGAATLCRDSYRGLGLHSWEPLCRHSESEEADTSGGQFTRG